MGIPVDAIYLDFAKAFDSVPHKRLIIKLDGYGIKGSLLNWIEHFLAERRQCVIVNGVKSSWGEVTSGIPQGSVLGPILFVVFINYMPESVKSCIQLFADDSKVYSQKNSPEYSEHLQEDRDNLQSWADKWQLRFNNSKCKILHLGHNNLRHEYKMTDKARNMGINHILNGQGWKRIWEYMDQDLKFSTQVENQVNKANKILGVITRAYEHIYGDSLKLYNIKCNHIYICKYIIQYYKYNK
jgi:ribonuclease P/MRP protein subunit RPP40